MNIKKWMKILLLGEAPPQNFPSLEPPEWDEWEADPEGFILFSTFGLRDGHAIASDLKRNHIPFRVSLDSGIDEVDFRFGSGGDCASLSLFVREEDWDIVNDIIEVRYHSDSERG